MSHIFRGAEGAGDRSSISCPGSRRVWEMAFYHLAVIAVCTVPLNHAGPGVLPLLNGTSDVFLVGLWGRLTKGTPASLGWAQLEGTFWVLGLGKCHHGSCSYSLACGNRFLIVKAMFFYCTGEETGVEKVPAFALPTQPGTRMVCRAVKTVRCVCAAW